MCQTGSTLASLGYEGSARRLSNGQQEKLKVWITEALSRTAREVGARIEMDCGVARQCRFGPIALLHWRGMRSRNPKTVLRKHGPAEDASSIRAYEDLPTYLADSEAVLFGNAVRPTHAVWPAGYWASKGTAVVVAQTSRQQRSNVRGAIGFEASKTPMLDAAAMVAAGTIMLLPTKTMYLGKRVIRFFLDNARHHNAKLAHAWLGRPGCRIALCCIPAYCLPLDTIERSWNFMHKRTTQNWCRRTLAGSSGVILTFLRHKMPRKRRLYYGTSPNSFCVASPKNFWGLTRRKLNC